MEDFKELKTSSKTTKAFQDYERVADILERTHAAMGRTQSFDLLSASTDAPVQVHGIQSTH